MTIIVGNTLCGTTLPNLKIKNEYQTVKDQINENDLKLVNELRELVKNDLTKYYDTNFNLLRWIQGYRNISIEEIAQKLRAHLKMRKSAWDLDRMAHKPRKHIIHNHWRYGITGYSKILENVIINIEQIGDTDYSGMQKTFSMQEVLKARTQDLEDMLAKCMECEAKTGKQASILYIMDLSGLKYDTTLVSLIRGSLRSLTEFMASHYVELVNKKLLKL